ncbi:MAG TPA: hypothetical protein VFH48_06435 [Chloroflexota bacterium]|nr:hypothetical protein [Chloroflexota bacterium]
MERGCLAAIGAVIALVSAFFVAAAVVESATGGDGKTSPGVYAGLIVFFGGTFVGGAYLVWRMLQKRSATTAAGGPAAEEQPAPPSEADRERQVLRFAEREHGRVTIPEVAASCDMTIAEAKATLDRLVTLQAAAIQVTRSGVLVYVFPGFMSDEDKAHAGDF